MLYNYVKMLASRSLLQRSTGGLPSQCCSQTGARDRDVLSEGIEHRAHC